ncbi:NAD(P)-binding protein [Oceanobacillus rekensis]|uniref:NAD(P)-binding protein n=1 Tax=Oceanobacillus rekensis TaxID=937927 RepID=UPI000B453A49|nr:NAD(P)-binding protein [Oceanobacillus rekensis]
MTAIPLMIELREKNVVIVGGGHVAERRIETLLGSGASLTVISLVIEKGIRSHWEKGRLNWKQKSFESNDVVDAFLIIVATNDPIVNDSVIEAAPTNSLINAAAEADKGDVEFPSFFRRGKLAISISTSGASPQLSAKLNRELQAVYSETYEDYLDFLYESRQLIKHSLFSKLQQKLLLKELLSESFLDKDKQMKAIKWFERVSRE